MSGDDVEDAFDSGQQLRQMTQLMVGASVAMLLLSAVVAYFRPMLPLCQAMGGPCSRWWMFYITVPLFGFAVILWAWSALKSEEELDGIASEQVESKNKPRWLRNGK